MLDYSRRIKILNGEDNGELSSMLAMTIEFKSQ